MLFLVTNRKAKSGFFVRRKADKGKIPPILTGLRIGRYMATKLELSGRKLNANLPFLAPYQKRGDILVASDPINAKLHFNESYIAEYARRQCVNFCLTALQTLRHPQVVLIDKEGECVGVAAELLAVCDTVWVATKNPELFVPCGQYTMEKYGTMPLFCAEQIPHAHLIIAPYGTQDFLLPTGIPIVGENGTLSPHPHDLHVPDYVTEITPKEFDPVAVTAGLFCAFYPKDLMSAVPQHLHCGNRILTPEQLFS
jgi:hypothetical protein